MKKQVLIVGGGGHAKVLIDCIKSNNEAQIYGVLDPKIPTGRQVCGVAVLGDDGNLKEYKSKKGVCCAIGVGMTKSSPQRKNVFSKVQKIGFMLPSFCHRHSWVSEDALLSDGVQVMAGAIVQPGAKISENVIVNTAAVIEHDCQIGAHSHVAPGAVIGGGVRIGECCHIGLGSRVLPNIIIGRNVTVGAGAVVTRNIAGNMVVAGIPAKPLKGL